MALGSPRTNTEGEYRDPERAEAPQSKAKGSIRAVASAPPLDPGPRQQQPRRVPACGRLHLRDSGAGGGLGAHPAPQSPEPKDQLE